MNILGTFFSFWLTTTENCADPGAPPNGLRRGNDFQHGKRVIFVCQPDFKLSGVNSITCNDGIWNDTIPVCTGKDDVCAYLAPTFVPICI